MQPVSYTHLDVYKRQGLGFRKQKYDVIHSREVMKTYVLIDGSARPQLLSLFEQVPFEIIELTQRIIDIAQEDLKMTFNVNLVVALADHIQFSVNQYKACLLYTSRCV